MSIQSEINRIAGNVSDAFDAIELKGVTVPSTATSDDLATLIGQISGGGSGAVSVVDTTDTAGGIIRTITAVDISDTTAVAADVAQGKYFYTADGTKTAGTSTGGGGGQYAWLGPGAEKVGTIINRTINLQNDTGYDDWTASTTAETLIPADTDPYYTTPSLNLNDYDYCFVTKGYIEPVYVSGTPETYRVKRTCQYHLYYTYGYPNTTITEQVLGNLTGNVTWESSSSNAQALVYYNSTGSIVSRSATQCGPLYMASIPTISVGSGPTDGVVTYTFKFPDFNAKCDSSRFSTTRKGQVDSANTNYIVTVDLYRIPRGNHFVTHLIGEMSADLSAV